MYMIEFKDIEIRYDDFVAMKDLNLTVEEGEFFTLLGPSGCGKTTTLRSLVGFVKPYSGEILVNQKAITHLPIEKRGIGIVFQSYALFPTMNVFENIAFGLKVKKLSKAEIAKKVTDIAQKVDLSKGQLTKNVSELSGGQQQRVAIARALILEPKMLCLDEPLSNLDAKLRGQLRVELKRLQRELGITTIYVTHDQEEALTLSDRIAVFNNGHIEQVGTPYEIYNKSNSEFVCDFIGDINRLESGIIQNLNQQMPTQLDEQKVGFIRIERVSSSKGLHNEAFAKIRGEVIESEYNGLYTKYVYNVDGEIIKNIEKNNGITYHAIGEVVDLYMNVQDIMQF